MSTDEPVSALFPPIDIGDGSHFKVDDDPSPRSYVIYMREQDARYGAVQTCLSYCAGLTAVSGSRIGRA